MNISVMGLMGLGPFGEVGCGRFGYRFWVGDTDGRMW